MIAARPRACVLSGGVVQAYVVYAFPRFSGGVGSVVRARRRAGMTPAGVGSEEAGSRRQRHNGASASSHCGRKLCTSAKRGRRALWVAALCAPCCAVCLWGKVDAGAAWAARAARCTRSRVTRRERASRRCVARVRGARVRFFDAGSGGVLQSCVLNAGGASVAPCAADARHGGALHGGLPCGGVLE